MTSIDALIPELAQACRALLQLAGQAGVPLQITSTLRTSSEQKHLYHEYLAGHSKYPAAPPGTSAHEFGYAFDAVTPSASDQNDFGTVWEQWGGVWGGRNRDPIHFEYPGFKAGVTHVSPRAGGAVYKLVDFLSGFVPWYGEVQLADTLFRVFGGDETIAEWYLQHPAEAIRDLLSLL